MVVTSASNKTSKSGSARRGRSNVGKTSNKQPVDKKLWPFFILQVLKRHRFDGAERDDEGNTYLTRGQIVEYLKEEHGIDTQIKAVGENLMRLYEAGLDNPDLGFKLEYLEGERNAADGTTSSKGGKQLLRKGWRLAGNSEFGPSEVRMLIDTVIASSVIPQRQAQDLIAKLLPLSDERIIVPGIDRVGHTPAANPQFFLNIELLNEAIQQHKRVRFVLGMFGIDGKLHEGRTGRQGKSHSIIPMQLLISKGHYYLLGHYPESDEIYKFRVDLMQHVEIIDDSHVDISESRVNVVKFREQHSYMMSGKVVKVVLRINKKSLHTLYDQFGSNVHFKNEKEDTIDVELKSALYSVLFWALQYYRTVEVLSPPELRQVLADAGSMIHKMYAEEPGTVGLADRQSNDELINEK